MKIFAIALASTALMAAPAFAQDSGTTTPAAATTAAAPNVTAGATVSDTSGAPVGTIDSVAGGNAVISTGTAKASIPVSSFAQGDKGLVIGMTKADLEAAVNKASKPAEIAVGTPVKGPQGGDVGKVAAITGNLVTVETPTTKVQLRKTAFAQAQGGALMIGMTAEQLDAAAKAASGKGAS
ncbi:hypothetical protein [Sphingomonas nostoxanthinifaciens]|uniref:hypothetical protein n=1 Tax=Sphingomonas nostoxanthinifaciens TaxID=2872652 RepID=UPI001CC1C751|nr:hypothetical protein [Sphingomonas nostoxanthinifaciens]UAK22936.1 hypothetical protein K8P63_10860 [Sphingomonas nostoxanthinifaciens]